MPEEQWTPVQLTEEVYPDITSVVDRAIVDQAIVDTGAIMVGAAVAWQPIVVSE
jgi:hypothetical protein